MVWVRDPFVAHDKGAHAAPERESCPYCALHTPKLRLRWRPGVSQDQRFPPYIARLWRNREQRSVAAERLCRAWRGIFEET